MIVIAGAGIGGLALGCALARAGRPFVVLERAADLQPAGAGITLAPNALRALATIGLEPSARAAGQELVEGIIADERGRVLVRARVGDGLSGATVALARSRLQEVLLAPVRDQVRTARAVSGFSLEADRVRVELDGGESVEGELLVGADGLRSAVRGALRGPEPLRYAGYTSWRAVVDGFTLERLDRASESWGPVAHLRRAPLRWLRNQALRAVPDRVLVRSTERDMAFRL